MTCSSNPLSARSTWVITASHSVVILSDVTLQHGEDTADYPRNYAVRVSNASQTGAVDGKWWSIAELQVSCSDKARAVANRYGWCVFVRRFRLPQPLERSARAESRARAEAPQAAHCLLKV